MPGQKLLKRFADLDQAGVHTSVLLQGVKAHAGAAHERASPRGLPLVPGVCDCRQQPAQVFEVGLVFGHQAHVCKQRQKTQLVVQPAILGDSMSLHQIRRYQATLVHG